MSTQSISSASEAALFEEEEIVCVSKRRAMRGYTGESRVRGGVKARDPAPQLSLLTLKPEEILRDVSGRRTGLTCRARCRRRRRSRRRGPPPGWSRVAATAPGPAPSWSTVRRIVARWQDTTVKRQSRFLCVSRFGPGIGEMGPILTLNLQSPKHESYNASSSSAPSPSFHGAEVVPPFKQVSIATRPTSPPSCPRVSREREPRVGVRRAFPSPPPTNIWLISSTKEPHPDLPSLARLSSQDGSRYPRSA